MSNNLQFVVDSGTQQTRGYRTLSGDNLGVTIERSEKKIRHGCPDWSPQCG
jgi:hypothetical protein